MIWQVIDELQNVKDILQYLNLTATIDTGEGLIEQTNLSTFSSLRTLIVP